MAEVFKLSKPIVIHQAEEDLELKELLYDFDNMTAKDKLKVSTKMKAAGIIINVEDLDPDYHLYLFAAAVNITDPKIDISDVLKMSARDSIRAGALARDFFYISSE